MLYLKHIYFDSSFAFASSFIRSGGVSTLSTLLLHPSLPLRGQAVDCLMQLTSHPSFDWFAPLDPGLYSRECHSSLLSLSTSPHFLSGLVGNAPLSAPPTFPGGSFLW